MDFAQVAILCDNGAAGWCKAIAQEIGRALRRHGILVQLGDLDAELAAFCARGNTIFLDFNRRVVLPWHPPAISLMVDHPCSLIKELSAPNSADAVTGWVDASHPESVAALGFRHRAVFLPHAGPAAADKVTPFDQRELDVFFAGLLAEPEDRSSWRAANPDASPRVIDLLFDTIERLETTGAPVVPTLLDRMNHHGVPQSLFTRESLAKLVTLILKIAETNRRLDVLAALPDALVVGVASNYLPKMLRDRPNIRHLGYIDDFDRIRALMRNSRIVLNTTMKFPSGSHERIWYAMAEGAVVLTDASAFMKRDFVDNETILYLPNKRLGTADLAPLGALARNPARLANIGEGATALYREHHSWDRRALSLIEAMRAA